MISGRISAPDFKGQFSGHETFPFRYGWLTKIVEALDVKKDSLRAKVFSPDQAISRFGVGKNMVSSMRHWALATGIAELDKESKYPTAPKVTDRGRMLLGPGGADPYMDHPATLWMIHWAIASTPDGSTTWYWAFNHHPSGSFDRDWLAADLLSLCRERQWRRIANNSLRRDIDCFIRTYLVGKDKKGNFREDSLECPLAELELIVEGSERGTFHFQRGPKPSLPDGVFALALSEFWERLVKEGSLSGETISLERLAYDPGSPGRVFKLDENSLTDRLARIEQTTSGVFRWVETAGLRQVQRFGEPDPSAYLRDSYPELEDTAA
jgi:hypothetical protein